MYRTQDCSSLSEQHLARASKSKVGAQLLSESFNWRLKTNQPTRPIIQQPQRLPVP